MNIVPAMLVTSGNVINIWIGDADMNSITKKCRACGKEKSIDDFYKDPRNPKWISGKCKTCQNEISKKWQRDNPGRALETVKKYQKNNPEGVKESNRKSRNKHREERLNSLRIYRESHRQELRDAAKEYRKNKRETFLESLRAWRDKNIEKIREYERKYRQENPDRKRVSEKNRRANKKQAGGKITLSEWNDLKRKYGYMCLRCKRIEPEIVLTLDHVMPVSLGGKNVIENAQPLCANCNSAKNNRHIDYRVES